MNKLIALIPLLPFIGFLINGLGRKHLFNFINAGDLQIPFAFQVDQLSTLFLLIITGVGFLIHVYSTSYMHEEKREHFGRYFSYLNLFVFSMLLLVMGANYVIMFIGWEGVGLCSYLLIGYWFKNTNYNKAANKAVLVTLAFCWLFSGCYRSLEQQIIQRYLQMLGSFLHLISQALHYSCLWVLQVRVPKYRYIPGYQMRWQVQRPFLH
jgi:NADH:ubiquinone oxidoreductase subunit 5 (subunit L)/multisubunit Na+/H+ antiporter MnhA subunit